MKKLILALFLSSAPGFAEDVRMLESSRLQGKLSPERFATDRGAEELYAGLSGPRYVLYTRDMAGFVSVSVKFGKDAAGGFACFSVFDEASTRFHCQRLIAELELP